MVWIKNLILGRVETIVHDQLKFSLATHTNIAPLMNNTFPELGLEELSYLPCCLSRLGPSDYHRFGPLTKFWGGDFN